MNLLGINQPTAVSTQRTPRSKSAPKAPESPALEIAPAESFQHTSATPQLIKPSLNKALASPTRVAEPRTSAPTADRKAVLAKLPFTSPMRHLGESELEQIPDLTFRLIDRYQTYRKEYAELPVNKGETVIVVPTYNEEKEIASTLDSLRRNGGGRDVVVSLNNTTDNTVAEIEKWAGSHTDVDLIPIEEDSRDSGLRRPGRQRFYLLQSPEPGKVGAMMRPLGFLKSRGAIPEKIFSIDADTKLEPGHLDQLESTSRERGLHAVCGKAHFEAPEGENLSTMNQILNRVHGEKNFESLIGNFVLYQSPDFFAGYKAIKETVPGIKTEDGLFGYLAAGTGRPVGVDKNVVVTSLGYAPGPNADKQRRRWIQGGAQMERLFGPLNEKIGAGGMDNPLQIVTSQVKSLYRDNPVGEATWKTLGIALQLGEGVKSAVEWVRGQDAPLEDPYHWVPQR